MTKNSTTFSKGDTVRGTIDTPSIAKGATYEVLAVQVSATAFGRMETYTLRHQRTGEEAETSNDWALAG